MTDLFLVDTDILIDFFRDYDKVVEFVNANSTHIILSSIAVAELYAGVKGDSELNALRNFVSLLMPLSLRLVK